MRNSPFWWILVALMILLDFYVFQAVKVVAAPAAPRFRTIVYYSYWIVSGLSLVTLFLLPYLAPGPGSRMGRSVVFAIIIGLFFSKLIIALFLLIDDVRRAIQWMAGKFFFTNTEGAEMQDGEKISRSAFLSWAGMLAGGGLFGTLIYGFGNKYRYQVKKVAMQFPNLPEAFRGLKIAQLSDIHSGSFTDKAAVAKGVEKLMEQKPDLILFTGDLVNNTADEMEPYIEVFSSLRAPLGVYSILGNHDYGDYVSWESDAHKTANLQRLKEVHQAMGWRLLMNEHVSLEKDGQAIALLGVENWSAKARFPKHGDLAKAHAGTGAYPFKILMSHDPSHWDAQVKPEYPDIDLMLSGHTHGMQFGIEIPGFRWSPVKYIYKQWAGLYEETAQKLYVNRGYGFIGYPGRVGILPEITLIELNT